MLLYDSLQMQSQQLKIIPESKTQVVKSPNYSKSIVTVKAQQQKSLPWDVERFVLFGI